LLVEAPRRGEVLRHQRPVREQERADHGLALDDRGPGGITHDDLPRISIDQLRSGFVWRAPRRAMAPPHTLAPLHFLARRSIRPDSAGAAWRGAGDGWGGAPPALGAPLASPPGAPLPLAPPPPP